MNKSHANTETMTLDNSTGSEETDDQGEIDEEVYPQLDDLPKKQRELIEAIAAQPEITQKELAEQFDVTRPTISRRVHKIEEFEWSDRKSFVEAVCDGSSSADVTMNGDSSETRVTNASQTNTGGSGTTGVDVTLEEIEDIHAELKHLNQRLANLEKSTEEPERSSESVFDDPELTHKIVHACIASDRITETEELRILKELMK